MTKNTLHYNYQATVREIYDLTKEEALAVILREQNQAKLNNRTIILTQKDYDESAFNVYQAEKLTRNFTWIHFCPQEILNFDDEEQTDKYYVIIFESVQNI